MIGKPYSGKLNVRFDEGELEIEPSATTPALYSTHLLHFGTIEEILARLRDNCWKYGFDVVPSFKRLYDSRNLVTLIGEDEWV